MSNPEHYYLVHTTPNCDWCLRALALLSHYQAEYRTTSERCESWPTWPAIEKVTPQGRELIGGYTELATLSFEGNGL